jgi:hypothetical protein
VAVPKAAPTATGAPTLLVKPAAAAPAPPSADPLADYTTAPVATGAPGSFPLGDPRNNGRIPDLYQDATTPVPPPAATRFFGLLRAEPEYTPPPGYSPGATTGLGSSLTSPSPIAGYLRGQAKAAVGEVPQDIVQGLGTAARGVGQIAKGNALPSLSADPRTWSAGGALTTAAGLAGAVFSPLTAATNKFVSQPVTELTGNPEIGERAGLVANLLAGGGLGGKAADVGAAMTPAARRLLDSVLSLVTRPLRSSSIASRATLTCASWMIRRHARSCRGRLRRRERRRSTS